LIDGEIVARVERRRKWTAAEKAALLAEVEAEGGKVAVVARRHRISDSLLYNWRSAWRAAASAGAAATMEFVPLGIVGPSDEPGSAVLVPPLREATEPPGTVATDRAGGIEIELSSGTRVRVDAFVNEKALSRVLRAMKGSL
jgi:transposase